MQRTNVMRERDEEREERARGGKKRRSPREERIRQDETRKHEQKKRELNGDPNPKVEEVPGSEVRSMIHPSGRREGGVPSD